MSANNIVVSHTWRGATPTPWFVSYWLFDDVVEESPLIGALLDQSVEGEVSRSTVMGVPFAKQDLCLRTGEIGTSYWE